MSDNTNPSRNPVALARVFNPGRPWIRTTYQLTGKILAASGSLDARFHDACRSVTYWIKTGSRTTTPSGVGW